MDRPARTRSHPEKGAQLFPEDPAGGEDGDSEEEHGPDSERGGDEAAFTEQLKELVDRFGDGEMLLLLGENQRVGNFEHRKGEREQTAGEKVGSNQGKGNASKRPE